MSDDNQKKEECSSSIIDKPSVLKINMDLTNVSDSLSEKQSKSEKAQTPQKLIQQADNEEDIERKNSGDKANDKEDKECEDLVEIRQESCFESHSSDKRDNTELHSASETADCVPIIQHLEFSSKGLAKENVTRDHVSRDNTDNAGNISDKNNFNNQTESNKSTFVTLQSGNDNSCHVSHDNIKLNALSLNQDKQDKTSVGNHKNTSIKKQENVSTYHKGISDCNNKESKVGINKQVNLVDPSTPDNISHEKSSSTPGKMAFRAKKKAAKALHVPKSHKMASTDVDKRQKSKFVDKLLRCKKRQKWTRKNIIDSTANRSGFAGKLTKLKPSKRKVFPKRKRMKRVALQESESSSDDNVPLSRIISLQRRTVEDEADDSGLDKTYRPSKKDVNSTDSEYSSNLSDNEKSSRMKDKLLEKEWMSAKKKLAKQTEMKRNQSKLEKAKRSSSNDVTLLADHIGEPVTLLLENNETERRKFTALLEKAKVQSQLEAEQRQNALRVHYNRLDHLLSSNGVKRKEVPPHGNCFFEAAVYCLAGQNPGLLRASTCHELEENLEEYIGFLYNRQSPSNDEEFLNYYLSEIESMKQDGYWSAKAGDFLPLALSNSSRRPVKIFTSKEDKPVIEIQPTIKSLASQEPIILAYISCPGVLEHYDACEMKSGSDVSEEPITTGNSQESSEDTEKTQKTGLGDQNTPLTKDYNSNDKDLNENSSSIEFTATPLNKDVDVESTAKKPTPRKAAHFITPVKKKLVRKRKATPENWKKNVRKRLRLCGKEYISTSGKITKAKRLEPADCSKCKFKCNTKFSETARQNVFESFWSLESYERQKDYVCARIEERQTRTYLKDDSNKKEKRKMVDRIFSLEEDGEKKRVCKKFFLATLAIGKAYIEHAMKGKADGRFHGADNRGRHTPPNKTVFDKLQGVREHIESFPRVESHYLRKDTNREFLEAKLTIPRMYDLYQEKCQEKSEDPVKLPIYRKVFNEEYNISFHVPKKDQCTTCTKYYTAQQDGTLTSEMKHLFEKHQERKSRARLEKENDKLAAKSSNNIYVATFDLQSVLYTPCSLVSLMYYMRKLCCYNLSFYSLGNNRGTCFLWSEVDGKRGSSEVATCLYLQLVSLPINIEHVILYSDACGGQNRNQIIATCLLNAVSSVAQLKMIDHKFLESGHTHMECDSMHSAVEFAKKRTAIFVPSQWDTVMLMARRKDPYTVIPLKHQDIIDFKDIQAKKVKSITVSDSGKKVQWTKIRWMRFMKADPEAVLIKYDIDDEFERVKLFGKKRGQPTLDAPLPKNIAANYQFQQQKRRICWLCASLV